MFARLDWKSVLTINVAVAVVILLPPVLAALGSILPDAMLSVSAALNSMSRFFTFASVLLTCGVTFAWQLMLHPMNNPRYGAWLRTTPWSADHPLPAGPVVPTPRALLHVAPALALTTLIDAELTLIHVGWSCAAYLLAACLLSVRKPVTLVLCAVAVCVIILGLTHLARSNLLSWASFSAVLCATLPLSVLVTARSIHWFAAGEQRAWTPRSDLGWIRRIAPEPATIASPTNWCYFVSLGLVWGVIGYISALNGAARDVGSIVTTIGTIIAVACAIVRPLRYITEMGAMQSLYSMPTEWPVRRLWYAPDRIRARYALTASLLVFGLLAALLISCTKWLVWNPVSVGVMVAINTVVLCLIAARLPPSVQRWRLTSSASAMIKQSSVARKAEQKRLRMSGQGR
jgi:hypothetical protein